MNYSNLPVYIKKQPSAIEASFTNIYDPTGGDNSLYISNLSNSGASIQYLESPFVRVSGNSGNYQELYAPKIISTNQDVGIYIPKFRSLTFYNLDGSRTQDPQLGGDLAILYFSDYDTGDNTINYINFNYGDYYLALRWSGSNDTYSLDYYDINYPNNPPVANIFYASGTGFSSGWKNYATSAYTGIKCIGNGLSASGMLQAINNPTGYSLYHTGDQGNFYVLNTTENSVSLTGLLVAEAVDVITGYLNPYSKLQLGAAYDYLPAQNISVDYSAQNDALRLLGVDIDQNDQFTHGAALQAKISFNSYINTETSKALNTILNSSGNDAYSIRFGNNIYNDCYLNNYDVAVEPFKPTVLSANYVVNNAPKINLNSDEYIPTVVPAATNYLLYSQNFSGSNYDLPNSLATLTRGFSDATGGYQAIRLSGRSQNITTYDYIIDNSESYTWTTITGTATKLTYLQSNTDLSTGINFTASKTFTMGSSSKSRVYISNNGIINFSLALAGYSNPQNQNFPITTSEQFYMQFIAAYWKDMFAGNGGSIWYRQDADRFIIEYNAVYGSATGQQQTFQIHLIFATGVIEIRYKSITLSGYFNPNPNIGIQWSSITNSYENYSLASIDISKSLKFIPSNTTTFKYASIVYNSKITPATTRTFSIYLKRLSGTGNIKYTLDGGTNYTTITPALTTSWNRYTFASNYDVQQIGIQIETYGDVIYLYAPQLEDGSSSSAYIPTLDQPVTRPESIVNIPVSVLYPQIDLTTGFANTMINGDNCAVSSTTGIVSDIQNSIRYSVNCGRTPIYNVGTTNANSFILDTVEKQMDISSTNLASFINYTGSKLSSDLNLTLKNARNITGSVISMKSGANVYTQQSNVQEGDTLVTQVSIKEIVV
jgi:hypothetical protein